MSESVLGSLGDRASPFCLALSCRPVSLQLRWGQLENVLHNFPLPRSPQIVLRPFFCSVFLSGRGLLNSPIIMGFLFLFLPFFLSLLQFLWGWGVLGMGGWGRWELSSFSDSVFLLCAFFSSRSDTSLLFPICSHQDPLSSVHFSRSRCSSANLTHFSLSSVVTFPGSRCQTTLVSSVNHRLG